MWLLPGVHYNPGPYIGGSRPTTGQYLKSPVWDSNFAAKYRPSQLDLRSACQGITSAWHSERPIRSCQVIAGIHVCMCKGLPTSEERKLTQFVSKARNNPFFWSPSRRHGSVWLQGKAPAMLKARRLGILLLRPTTDAVFMGSLQAVYSSPSD